MAPRNRTRRFAVAGSLIFAIGMAAQPQRNPSPQRPRKIEYFVEKSDDSMFSTLKARANGKTYTLIDKSEEACLVVVDQRDWDGNGLTDALVARVTACGGNCCPDGFFFVSALGYGQFKTSHDLADSWKDPVIEKWKNHWSVVIVSTNAGMNSNRPEEITRRFILQAGQPVKVEESLRREIKASWIFARRYLKA
jgi:hypothetical protein